MEPNRLTEPLSLNEDGLPQYSDGYRLIELVEKYWSVKGKPLRLDDWQKHLLVRVLERCPPGHPRAGALRYRQVVISIPRQAGKSLLAAVLSLYGLLQHTEAPKVLGVARTVQQANVVYGYTREAVDGSQALREVLTATGTRGIRKSVGLGSYVVLTAKPESVQGYESSLAICDELHVMQPEIWDAIVESQTAQAEPLLIGITTAGDISSVLLKRLYVQGDRAIDGGQEAFGFFVWESLSDELTVENITQANPAIACGRIDAQTIIDDCRSQPRNQWLRYRLNRFVEGLAEPWVPLEAWQQCAGTGLTDFSDCVYAIDVSSKWKFATVVAAKRIDGIVYTSTVLRLVNPSIDKLKAAAGEFRKRGKCSIVVDGYHLNALATWLEQNGYEVERVRNRSEPASAVYGLIMQGKVNHDNNPVTNAQHATARTKTRGESFTIVGNGNDIESCYASVYAIHAADIKTKRGIGVA